jgi:hypothetical protein
VESLECRLRDGEVELTIHSKGDIDLEQWGADTGKRLLPAGSTIAS